MIDKKWVACLLLSISCAELTNKESDFLCDGNIIANAQFIARAIEDVGLRLKQ